VVAPLATGFTIAAVAWGVLAFGAVYAWAYWPLAAAAVTAGVLGLSAERRTAAGISRSLTFALGAFGAAVVVQLVPLPRAALDAISPASAGIVDQLVLLPPGSVDSRHALSIHPRATATALALFGSFTALAIGRR
jgi:hypothetical protein